MVLALDYTKDQPNETQQNKMKTQVTQLLIFATETTTKKNKQIMINYF